MNIKRQKKEIDDFYKKITLESKFPLNTQQLIDKIEKQVPAYPYPGSTGKFPNFPNTKYVVGDTPETWKNQPTCYCYDKNSVDLTYKPSES